MNKSTSSKSKKASPGEMLQMQLAYVLGVEINVITKAFNCSRQTVWRYTKDMGFDHNRFDSQTFPMMHHQFENSVGIKIVEKAWFEIRDAAGKQLNERVLNAKSIQIAADKLEKLLQKTSILGRDGIVGLFRQADLLLTGKQAGPNIEPAMPT